MQGAMSPVWPDHGVKRDIRLTGQIWQIRGYWGLKHGGGCRQGDPTPIREPLHDQTVDLQAKQQRANNNTLLLACARGLAADVGTILCLYWLM